VRHTDIVPSFSFVAAPSSPPRHRPEVPTSRTTGVRGGVSLWTLMIAFSSFLGVFGAYLYFKKPKKDAW